MSMPRRLDLTRAQILAFRRAVGALDARLAPGAASLRRAAWAGLQDSMPRAALLAIHARVAGTRPDTWEDPALIQVWGPRFSAYVVAVDDRAVFTLGRLPDAAAGRRFAQETADRLEAVLAGRRLSYAEAGRALGMNPNALRYAAPTGRVLIRWEGARRPTIWAAPAPAMDPGEARLELARRYLHVLGPATAASFAQWAGIPAARGPAAFAALGHALLPVATPVGDAWILAADEPAFRSPAAPPAPARLLPSGDAYWLLQGRDRELLVLDAERRPQLWTPRVWPGAVLLHGEVAGIWRRDAANVTIAAWRPLSPAERAAVEAEVATLPLPDAHGRIRVRWVG
ncbi:MAG TPA: crosslink repair DNA glycosylase YcaQ family protein [Thermomicrobiales bacterium]|nr:crosslink repair DNA glycosylase YcaQ family protein [Thermomicrobiales bacterium]